MEDFIEDIKKNRIENNVNFWGVVEDNNDPMAIGRVKVRCFHYHTNDISEIPTEALPWALVLQPTNSSSISGIGDFSPLQLGTWVYGFFMDGRDAQYPVVTHSVPGVHRPDAPGKPSGTATGYLDTGDYHGGMPNTGNEPSNLGPWNQGISSDGVVDYSNPAEQGPGAITAVGDINMMLQPKDADRFKSLGLTIYTAEPCPEGLACKDGKKSLRFHYGTALALEKLTKDVGLGKFYLTSAYRTPEYNSRVSYTGRNGIHTQGRALDIPFSSIGGGSKAALAAFGKKAVKCGFVGFGIYWKQQFIHIDTGKGRTWNGASEKWFKDAIRSAGWYELKKGLEGISTNSGSSEDSNDSNSAIDTNSPNQQYIADRLKAEGYSDTQIAAVMGHLQEESGFDPTAIGDGGDAYGIAQWNSRRQELFNYTGTRTPSLQQQTDFLIHELNTSESAAGNQLKNSTTLYEASRAFANFERYQGYNNPLSPSSKRRMQHAENFYNGGTFPENNISGFVDPTNSLPTPEYRGEPSTNMNARGFNTYSNQYRILSKDAGRLTGFPAAGDIGTFGEPELKAAPQYPYNNVKSSRSGHLIEMDDTPGAERLNIEHKSGSSLEMFVDGSTVRRTAANEFNTVNGDYYQGIMGKGFITSVNDLHIRSTADLTTQADGAMNIYMGNDGNLMISGDYLISVGEDVKIRAAKIFFESEQGIDLFTPKTINIEGKAGVSIKSDAAVEIQGGSKIGLKSPTVYADDVMRVGEGGAKSVGGAESADLGKPPARKVVDKDNMKSTANRKGSVTTEEAYNHYASSMRGPR